MEQWSVRDERPPPRPAESSFAWLAAVLVLAVIAALVAAYTWYVREHHAPQPERYEAAAQTPSERAPEASAEPAIRHPIAAPQPETAKPLPALEMSDTMMRHSLVDLIGGKAFAAMVIPAELVRRIVATVDNLPRETAPQRMIPLKPVPGSFATAGSGEAATLDTANFARYAPYVRVLESVNTRALVSVYVEAYPLFQRAYEELGYPGRHFNDRLMQALDDLLAAPERDGPVELMRPKVLYEFADPDLETRSAGQKILIRMGSDNASRVKAKLREIRRELIAASERRP